MSFGFTCFHHRFYHTGWLDVEYAQQHDFGTWFGLRDPRPSKGLSERRVMWSYAARNALLPNVTGLGMALGFVVSGALLTEIIFLILAWAIS